MSSNGRTANRRLQFRGRCSAQIAPAVFERRLHLGHRLKPLRRCLLQTAADEALESGRRRQGRGIVAQNPMHHLEGRVPAERATAAEQLVQHRAEAEDVSLLNAGGTITCFRDDHSGHSRPRCFQTVATNRVRTLRLPLRCRGATGDPLSYLRLNSFVRLPPGHGHGLRGRWSSGANPRELFRRGPGYITPSIA